jgi:cytochrome c-type biogenesis protein CcmF
VIGSAALIVSRLDDLRSERRIESLASRESVFLINNLLLVGLAAVIFWGTFFPLISEAVTGERSSLGSPWFDRYTAPLAIALVLFTGIGPLLAWRQISAGMLWRLVRGPLAVATIATAAVAVLSDALSEPAALVLFAFAFFALAALAAEFYRGAAAQRALSDELGWVAALTRVVSRNRRRYGGYIVHAGFALLLIAIAASSSFQTSVDLRLLPGESGQVGDFTVNYVEPTSTIDSAEQRLNFGAVVEVEREGEPFATLRPSRNYYSSVASGGSLRGFFEGEATSEVGRRARPSGDLWTAMRPDLARYDAFIDEADRRIERATGSADAEQAPFLAQTRSGLQGLAVAGLAERYRDEPVPVDFRVNVNPLVIWIWVGGAIAVIGAMVALWPVPEARSRRVSDLYAARLARDLERV